MTSVVFNKQAIAANNREEKTKQRETLSQIVIVGEKKRKQGFMLRFVTIFLRIQWNTRRWVYADSKAPVSKARSQEADVFGVLKPLPILILSHFDPKNGFPAVEALTTYTSRALLLPRNRAIYGLESGGTCRFGRADTFLVAGPINLDAKTIRSDILPTASI